MASTQIAEHAGTCALCGQPAALRNSHILPAFVFRWLRDTSSTGHIRTTDNINQRVQDGWKKHWLCASCEEILSRDEREFASRLFHPWQSGNLSIEYHSWLQRFCTSISWRVLSHCKGNNPNHVYSPEEDRFAASAEQVWREYLLGKRKSIGKFEQHILPLDIIEDTTISDLPDNINRYLARHVEMDIIGDKKMMMTYAKLGGFAIFGMIRQYRKWEGTRVYGDRGTIAPRRYTLPGEMLGFFKDRARHVKAALEELTPTQAAKIDAALLGGIDRAANSPHMRAIMADAAMFGRQAILRKRPG
jgi:hypothetical protein